MIGPDRLLGISANTVETALAAERAGALVEAVKAAGFRRATLDLEGYSMGSMNVRSVSGQ